jgi:hypothetical protein
VPYAKLSDLIVDCAKNSAQPFLLKPSVLKYVTRVIASVSIKMHGRCSQIWKLAEPFDAFVIDGVIQRSGKIMFVPPRCKRGVMVLDIHA